ncbi:MAG: glycosyltransferase family 4 protein [Arcobacter sp.]|nr:glycosyltransferase family 4 protein [Arcobacter sp.]
MKKKIQNVSIIHSNWIYPTGHLAYLLSKKYKIPFSISLMGTDVHKLKHGTKYWKVAKNIIEKANIVTSVSQELIDRCIRMDISIPKVKSLLLDNIYDIEKFRILDKNQLRETYNFSFDYKIILFVGGLVEIKNIDILIKAFSLLDDRNSILLIAGDGPEKNGLEYIVSSLKLEQRILFLGNLNSENLVNYYNVADVLCLPSKNEGTPNVIVEALLCGLPVVATNVGGIPNLISSKINGYLVEPNDSVSLKKYLEVCITTQWDRMKLRSSVEKFYPSNVKQTYDQLFTKLSLESSQE